MVYRIDVILGDGARRRASYDTDKPQIIEISKCPFGPKDVMLRVMRSVRADCVVVIGTFEGLGASW